MSKSRPVFVLIFCSGGAQIAPPKSKTSNPHKPRDQARIGVMLKSFWANEAVFQLMMLAFNLFLLFKIDSPSLVEHRQQIKTFLLKYVFLAAKIIKTARNVIIV